MPVAELILAVGVSTLAAEMRTIGVMRFWVTLGKLLDCSLPQFPYFSHRCHRSIFLVGLP